MIKFNIVKGDVEIEPQDVKEFIVGLLNYINKDKNALCYVLEVTVKNIREWHESFTRVFNDEVMKLIEHKELTDEELKRYLINISSFIDRRKNFDIADASILFLKRIQDPDEGPSRSMSMWDRITGRFFVDVETIEKVKKIEELEYKFRKDAMNMKIDYRDTHILYLDKYSHLSTTDIVDVKRTLENIKNEIITLITEVRQKIGCKEQTINILHEEKKNQFV